MNKKAMFSKIWHSPQRLKPATMKLVFQYVGTLYVAYKPVMKKPITLSWYNPNGIHRYTETCDKEIEQQVDTLYIVYTVNIINKCRNL